MMNSFFRLTQMFVVLSVLLSACSPQADQPPTAVDVEQAVNVMPTVIAKPSSTAAVTLSETPTSTPIVASTNTPVPTPTDVLALIGTPLAERSEVIGLNNYGSLKRIGQWGRGSIQGVGFTPDGQSFIAISELGWSIYNMNALDQPPQWVAFDKPMIFDEFYFSSDGTMIKFRYSTWNSSATVLKSFPSAEPKQQANGVVWLNSAQQVILVT